MRFFLAIIVYVLLYLYLLAFCQTVEAQNYGTVQENPFIIRVTDQHHKELAYFRYDTATNLVTSRGTQSLYWRFFFKSVYYPMIELQGAQWLVLDCIRPDGSIPDLPLFRERLAYLLYIKQKYGFL